MGGGDMANKKKELKERKAWDSVWSCSEDRRLIVKRIIKNCRKRKKGAYNKRKEHQ